MILDADRQQAVVLIDEAVVSGAACYKACNGLGLAVRTYESWVRNSSVKFYDRPRAQRPEPSNKLSEAIGKELSVSPIARNTVAYRRVR
jgi:putative transposase